MTLIQAVTLKQLILIITRNSISYRTRPSIIAIIKLHLKYSVHNSANCSLTCQQVGELFWALRDIGRDDLAMELLERNQTFQILADRHAEGRLCTKYYVHT